MVLAPTSNQARGGTVSERFCLIAAPAVDPALLLPPSAGEAEALSRRRVRSRWLGVGDSGHPALTGGSAAKEGIRTSRQRSFERGASTEPARASKHRMHTFGDEQVARDGGQYTCFAMVAVLGSHRFDTIAIVPLRDPAGLALTSALARALAGTLQALSLPPASYALTGTAPTQVELLLAE